MKDGKPGIAVTCLKMANENFKKSGVNKKLGMGEDLLLFYSKFNKERELIEHIYQEYEKDNSKIYHETVANEKEVKLPQGKSFTKNIPFEPPAAVNVNIIQQEGSWCSIM